jgi:DNA-binding NtrC family response regulator
MSAIRFLIVDASPSLHTFMQQLLTGYGFEPGGIKCVSDPMGALEVAKELQPDFLLTDWFPKEPLQGIALHQKILAINPDCRFAMLSTDASNNSRQLAQEAGAIFLMQKPCTAQQLRLALANAMELLAVESPKMSAHVRATRNGANAVRTPAPPMTTIPKFEVGEQVIYQGRRASVKYVILRRGELVVQLHGMLGLIQASEVQKA